MTRETLWTALRRTISILPLLLVACGGSGNPASPDMGDPSISQFTSDRPSYFVGERAQLSATFAHGTGRIEPGDIAISSGQTITTPALSANTTYRLTVVGTTTTATRDLALPVSYRDRMRTIPMSFTRADHAAVTLNDGRVLIVGGVDGSKMVSRLMYVFDPSSETFTQLGSLIAGRVLFAAVTLADGNVLIIGGASGAPNTVVVNAQTGAAVPTPNQPHTIRVGGTATRLPDNKILILGGRVSVGLVAGATDPSAEIYDPAAGTFTVLPTSLSVGRYEHTAVATNDGRVLIYGGVTDSGQPPPPELYNPATGAFTVLTAPESSVRINHAAVRALDGSIWIVGGDDNTNTTALTSVIRFDPGTLILSHALDLATPRSSAGAAALTDSRVLIAGGTSAPGQTTDSSELIAPGTAQRRDGPQMSSGQRYGHTMTTLSNGKILVVGGLDPNGNPLATAEIYE